MGMSSDTTLEPTSSSLTVFLSRLKLMLTERSADYLYYKERRMGERGLGNEEWKKNEILGKGQEFL